jgi:hypothetical protein
MRHQREIAIALHNIPEDTLEDGEGIHPKKERGQTKAVSGNNGHPKDIYDESSLE